MKSWDEEREEYFLSKRASEEMAAICFGVVGVMILLGLALEAYQRVCAWISG